MISIVLFERSTTQRVVLSYTETSCLLSKEWRKSKDEEWKLGKSIDIPLDYIQKFIDVLVRVQKEKGNGKTDGTNSGNNKKTNNRH